MEHMEHYKKKGEQEGFGNNTGPEPFLSLCGFRIYRPKYPGGYLSQL